MIDDETIADRLVDELEAVRTACNGQPVAAFACTAFDAYTLVAVLQLASRHPNLSDVQLDVVLDIARQVAGQLIDRARAFVGTDSTIETTLLAGFDPDQDRPLATEGA